MINYNNEIYHNHYNDRNCDHLADTLTDRIQVKIKDVIDDGIEADEIHLKDRSLLPWDHPSVLIAIKDPKRKKPRRFIGSDISQEST